VYLAIRPYASLFHSLVHSLRHADPPIVDLDPGRIETATSKMGLFFSLSSSPDKAFDNAVGKVLTNLRMARAVEVNPEERSFWGRVVHSFF
jgi:hypothetical protein